MCVCVLVLVCVCVFSLLNTLFSFAAGRNLLIIMLVCLYTYLAIYLIAVPYSVQCFQYTVKA